MNYNVFWGKNVKIIFVDGHSLTAIIDVCCSPQDNDPEGEWGLGLNNGLWINESEIKSIEIVTR